MITNVSLCTLYVIDQDAAKAFYDVYAADRQVEVQGLAPGREPGREVAHAPELWFGRGVLR